MRPTSPSFDSSAPPTTTYLRPALDAISLVQHEPGVPAVTVDRHCVPLVQQDGFLGAHFPGAGTTIEPVSDEN